MTEVDPATVFADMLAASADDIGLGLTRRDVIRLAERTVELLAVAGYVLDQDDG